MARQRRPGEIWRQRMSETLAGAQRELEAAQAGAGVHEARRQLKRARALLRLVKPILSHEDFSATNRGLKHAADRLAVTRSAEAMLEAVGQLAPKTQKIPPVIAALGQAAGMAHRDTATAAEREQAVADARQSIAAVQTKMASFDLPDRDCKPYLKGLRLTYAEARRRLARGLATGDIETLHEARKFIIRHLHHLEFLSPLWPDLFKAWVAEAQRLRQALGDLHDLAELQAQLSEAGSPYAELVEKDEAMGLIRKRRKKLLRRIKNHQPRLFAEPPKALARRAEAMWRRDA